MCNAWNHPPGCTCGWGGEGHLGRSGGWFQPYVTPRPARLAELRAPSRGRYAELDDYAEPNATCPVCGAEVYFYQSPYGGRVYFDALGPPWPKHPCTDNDDERDGDRSGPRSSGSSAEPMLVTLRRSVGGLLLLEGRLPSDGTVEIELPAEASALDTRSPVFVCRSGRRCVVLGLDGAADGEVGVVSFEGRWETAAPPKAERTAPGKRWRGAAPRLLLLLLVLGVVLYFVGRRRTRHEADARTEDPAMTDAPTKSLEPRGGDRLAYGRLALGASTATAFALRPALSCRVTGRDRLRCALKTTGHEREVTGDFEGDQLVRLMVELEDVHRFASRAVVEPWEKRLGRPGRLRKGYDATPPPPFDDEPPAALVSWTWQVPGGDTLELFYLEEAGGQAQHGCTVLTAR